DCRLAGAAVGWHPIQNLMRLTIFKNPVPLYCLLLSLAFLGLTQTSSPAAGKTQKLFNGKDLTGWRQPTGTWWVAKAVSLDPADEKNFVIAPGKGVLVNCASGHTVDLISEAEFGDMQAHVEFCVT